MPKHLKFRSKQNQDSNGSRLEAALHDTSSSGLIRDDPDGQFLSKKPFQKAHPRMSVQSEFSLQAFRLPASLRGSAFHWSMGHDRSYNTTNTSTTCQVGHMSRLHGWNRSIADGKDLPSPDPGTEEWKTTDSTIAIVATPHRKPKLLVFYTNSTTIGKPY